MTKHHDLPSRILKLAARPDGMRASDLPDVPSGSVTSACYLLVNKGRLFRAKLAHKHTRYYTDKEAADRAQAQIGYSRTHKTETKATAAAAVRAPSFAKATEVILTDKTKFTTCPGFKPRFESMTPTFVHVARQSGRITRAPDATG